MPITTIRIHPALGIARVGNSPDFFIGPEKPVLFAPPAGGYKDSRCRVKRQACRFRLFAFDQNGAFVQEITAADAVVNWTVHLVNRKSAALKFREGLALGLKTLPGDHPSIAGVRAKLGNLLVATKRFVEAEQMLLAAADAREGKLGRDHTTTKLAMADVVTLYDAWGKTDQAAEWRGRSTTR